MPLFDHDRGVNHQGPAQTSVYADGAPMVHPHTPSPWDCDPEPADRPQTVVWRASKAVSRVRSVEGLRGYSNRLTVMFRQFGALLSIMGCTLVANWAFSAVPQWQFGGVMLLFSVAFILTLTAIGTVLYPESRFQILDQARHFAFGIVALPAAALALFMRVVSSALETTSTDDMFISILKGNGLPLVYFSVVCIPAMVFAKYIFGGLRTLNRKALADEEAMATYMRQDQLQK